jgi:hypothetical protein
VHKKTHDRLPAVGFLSKSHSASTSHGGIAGYGDYYCGDLLNTVYHHRQTTFIRRRPSSPDFSAKNRRGRLIS